ncbi:unnamed protein product, partial [Rotaria sp. Silwood1]
IAGVDDSVYYKQQQQHSVRINGSDVNETAFTGYGEFYCNSETGYDNKSVDIHHRCRQGRICLPDQSGTVEHTRHRVPTQPQVICKVIRVLSRSQNYQYQEQETLNQYGSLSVANVPTASDGAYEAGCWQSRKGYNTSEI